MLAFASVIFALAGAANPPVVLRTQKAGEDTITLTRQLLRAPDPANGEGELEFAWRRSGPGHPDERRILYRGRCQIGAPEEEMEVAGRACRVEANHLEIIGWTRNYGRRWRFQLAPLLLASQGANVQQGAGGGAPGWPRFEASWDWQAGTGGGKTVEIRRSRCVKGAEEDGRQVERKFLSVPMISAPEAYRKDGWKREPLGSCGLEVGGAKSPGFLVQGERRGAQGPAFKVVLMSAKELLVEVFGAGGPGGAGGGANWIHADHLEVWLGRDQGKAEELSAEAFQWGIRVSDGAVFPASGEPRAPLKVERAARNGVVALKITLPTEGVPPSLAISYGKGSQGSRAEYLLGTSALCFGVGETLGPVTVLPKRFGRCEVQKDALDLTLALPPTGEQPLLTEDDLPR